MMGALWVSKTGLNAQDTALRAISNNLANVATTGFKRDRGIYQDLLYQIDRQPGGQSSQDTQLPSGLQLGTGVRIVGTQKIFTPGTLQITEQPLDLAINGRGFFQVVLPDGQNASTRDGGFQISANGEIVTSDGLVLQPPVTIPENASTITIGTDGVVSVAVAGSPGTTQVGTVQVVDFVNPAGLQSVGGNLFIETTASGGAQAGTAGQNGLGNIRQGTLEASNVSVVEELVNMIATQRAYEMNSKVVATADQMLQYVGSNL